jgi:hypothetical protein
MADEKKKPRVRPTSGRDVKKRKTYLLPIREGLVFRMRRVDISMLFMEGLIPMPLLGAVDRLESLRRKVGETNQISSLADVSPEDIRNFNEVMRRAAVIAVIAPKLTHSKKASLADPDLVWAGGYSDLPDEAHLSEQDGDITPTDLMIIWRAICGEAGIITMSDDEADEFRSDESQSHDSPVRDGDGLRTEAVVVVPPQTDDTPKKVRIIHH